MKTQRIYESYIKKGGNNGVFEIHVSLPEPAKAQVEEKKGSESETSI